MRQRTMRWLVALAVALVLGFGMVMGDRQTPVAHGAEPTPTPTQTTDGQPGGDGGGH
jgi:hypothetical protein